MIIIKWYFSHRYIIFDFEVVRTWIPLMQPICWKENQIAAQNNYKSLSGIYVNRLCDFRWLEICRIVWNLEALDPVIRDDKINQTGSVASFQNSLKQPLCPPPLPEHPFWDSQDNFLHFLPRQLWNVVIHCQTAAAILLRKGYILSRIQLFSVFEFIFYAAVYPPDVETV